MDPSSFANVTEVVTLKHSLDLVVDFERQTLSGSVVMELVAVGKAGKIAEVTLDTRDLDVKGVYAVGPTSQPLDWHFAETHEALGTALVIKLARPLSITDVAVIRIEYATAPTASAVQWLSAEQTADKNHPYLFTQCQAIHARSLMPCQDTPVVKAPYEARLTVPAPLVALMSAVSTGSEPVAGSASLVTFTFAQRIPIPSYLIAIVVGDIRARDVGPRSRVWSEPSMVEAAATELEDTETFIATGESLLGEYVWGRYDVVVLPPSFPYGGMENPCLTFVTPTIIAGDKSLVDVVAHEIAHSWMGNLVTSRGWSHFWLNEGHTVYIERQIQRALHGEDDRQFHAQLGWNALKRSVDHFGAEHEFTRLCPPLGDADPDDAFSSVPYEKGFNLLYYLEGLVGGSDVFVAYLRAYVEAFQFESITTQQWLDFFLYYFSKIHPIPLETLDSIDWEAWFHGPGMPPVTPEFGDRLARECYALAQAWCAAPDGAFASAADVASFSSPQTVLFLETLANAMDTAKEAGDEAPLSAASLVTMDAAYNLSSTKNSEVRMRWSALAVKAEHSDAFAGVVDFITSQGRMKFVRPLYKALAASESGHALAVKTFAKHGSMYHPIAAKMIETDLADATAARTGAAAPVPGTPTSGRRDGASTSTSAAAPPDGFPAAGVAGAAPASFAAGDAALNGGLAPPAVGAFPASPYRSAGGMDVTNMSGLFNYGSGFAYQASPLVAPSGTAPTVASNNVAAPAPMPFPSASWTAGPMAMAWGGPPIHGGGAPYAAFAGPHLMGPFPPAVGHRSVRSRRSGGSGGRRHRRSRRSHRSRRPVPGPFFAYGGGAPMGPAPFW